MSAGFVSHRWPLRAVDDVSFEVRKGETVGLVGESGCGKSVTALSILRLLGPAGRLFEGEIWFDGRNLAALNEREMRKIRGADIGMVFQEPMASLNPVRTIGEHIAEPLRIHRRLSKQAARSRAVELLKAVGIPRAEQVVDEYPHRLSGGMRQRVMIASAIACQPKLLIADEPTTALDVTIQAQILDLLRDIRRTGEMATLLITHDLGVVAETCDRVIVMYAGQVVEQGTVRDIFRRPAHPYTAALLRSLPRVEGRQERLASIPGSVPSLDRMPTGCRFAGRCVHAVERCRTEPPPMFSLETGQSARCWLHEEGAASV
ncbi:MAG: ABC transporter ATP-binding protein [Alicyclobacillus sp.]|nr:ABC transporter ATP-binding protein [Alicyclobacillus sp.]